jgi:hypothetical protein
MWELYKRSKVWLNSQLNSLIDMGDSWVSKARYISWSFGRAVVRAVARWLAALSWLVRDWPRMTAYKATGSNWTIVFMGSETERIEVEYLFFPDQEITWGEIGRVALWRLARQTQIWQSEGVDLVICQLSRLFPLSSRIAFSFSVPTLIGQIINFPEKLETLIAGGKRRRRREQINAAQRKGFDYQFSRSINDYEQFYHKMYVPHIKARHGPRARVATYDGYLKELFHQGGLLLVTQHDRVIAGGVRYMANGTCFSVEHGILDADTQLLKQGANMLLDWYTILWASNQGAEQYDLGGSRAWRSNGVFSYKASWGSRITSFDYAHSVWHVYARELSPAMRDHINQIGFITEIKGDFYTVFIDSDDSGLMSEKIKQTLDDAKRKGLKGVVILTPNSRHILTDQVEPDPERENA